MMVNGTKIHPLTGDPLPNGKGRNGHARQELIDAFVKTQNEQRQNRRVAATYDAARDSDEFRNYWANADTGDADSSNSRDVRAKLVPRSRYEVGNNGFADGIAQTYATDLVGTGPKLRMQSGSPGFNQLVEFWWGLWAKSIQLRRKLWCQAHAKHVDGEGFGVVRRNPGVKHPVKLDYVLYETEQFQTPMLPWVDGYIDGVKFDQWGNPEHYDLLRAHPGAGSFTGAFVVPEQVPAAYVMHWFLMRRPGQHRAVPECTSTLNTGAAARRWREATLAAAETAADFSVLLKTAFQPDEMAVPSPFSSLDIQKRMMTALPDGWSADQMKAEHPGATYGEFHGALINEQARPKSMPLNKAKADSSGYNYASGRLDFQTYYGAIDVDREDGNDLVLDPLFLLWFDLAVVAFGWLGGDPEAIGPTARLHSWDWPKHAVADISTESTSTATRLQTGQATLSQVYSENGEDFEDRLPEMAADYGLTPEEMRARLLNATFNNQNQQASMQQAETQAMQAETAAKAAEHAAKSAAPTQDAPADAGTAKDAAASGDVQATALNGAQIASMVQIATAAMQAALPVESARAMLYAAFPLMERRLIDTIVDAIKQAGPAAPQQPAPAAPAAAAAVLSPEWMERAVAAIKPPDVIVNVQPTPVEVHAAPVVTFPEIIVNPTPIQVAAPVVNVEAPAVNVAAPNVTVESPTVNVAAAPAPQVTVEAPVVHVAPPAVTVEVAAAPAPNVTVEAAVVNVPATVVNLPAPVVHVEPSVVHVDTPPVSLTVQPPVVNVAAPEPAVVNVAAPIVNVEAQPAPIVNVAPAQVTVEAAAEQEFDIVAVRDPDTQLVVKYLKVPKGGGNG